MIFDGIEFHNVAEMIPEEGAAGWKMSRLPRAVAVNVSSGVAENTSFMSSGVELRFTMPKGGVTIHLQALPNEEAQTALLYFGCIQGGWRFSTKTILETDTAIHIEYPDELEKLEKIRKEAGFPFSSRVVRLVLPYGTLRYLGKEGITIPPTAAELPAKTYLAYGSSITHGSLGLITPLTYVFSIGQILGTDTINQGYAGSACMERAMADYLVSRKDWDFASLELGVNMLGTDLSNDQYADRIRAFLEPFIADSRPIFVTDIFINNDRLQERAEIFRRIVCDAVKGTRLLYTPGKELLSDPALISADLVHPTLEGQACIAKRWSGIMTQTLNL